MSVTGLRETLAAFDTVEREARVRLCKVTADTVARVRAGAYASAPVGAEPGPFKGHMRDQIKSQMVLNEPFGAVFVERTISGNAGTDNRGVWTERGTVHQGARPFLRPAAEAERSRYLADLQAALDLVTRGAR